MRTKFFCTNFFNTARGPGHPGKNPGTSQIPVFETQGRRTFEGGHEVFGHHPSAWKTPTPPGGLRTQKVNLCALFSCLNLGNFSGLKEKLSRPVVDTKTLWKPRKPYIYHWNLSSVAAFFSAKKSSALEQGGVCFLFPSLGTTQISGKRSRSEKALKTVTSLN